MRILLSILFILPALVFSQETSEAVAKSRKKQVSYFGAHTDLVFSRLEGVEGNDRKLYIEDYVEDLNHNGIAAEGGIYGRYASSFGVYYDQFIGQRFALHVQASYLQTGYRERLKALGSTDNGDVNQSVDFKANLDYIHFLGGIKYYNDFGITLMLGGFVNYNTLDKIKNEELKVTSGRFGDEESVVKEELFFHEYYGENRTIFLTGGAFTMGYRWKRYEADFSFKATTQILSETDDMYYYIYQLGFKYQLTGLDD